MARPRRELGYVEDVSVQRADERTTHRSEDEDAQDKTQGQGNEDTEQWAWLLGRGWRVWSSQLTRCRLAEWARFSSVPSSRDIM